LADELSQNTYAYKTINGKKKRIHRHIMAAFLDRELESNEHVYHVNGDPADNRIENLIVMTRKNGKING